MFDFVRENINLYEVALNVRVCPISNPIFLFYFFYSLYFLLPRLPAIDSIHNKYVSEKNDSLRIKYHLKYIYLLKNAGRQKEAEAEIALAKKELEQHPVASLLPVLFFYEGGLKYDQADYLQSIISFEHSLKTSRPAAEKDTYDYTIGHSVCFIRP